MPDADAVSLIADVCDYIRANLESPLTLAALGRQAGMSPAHLQRVFKRVVGVSPRQFADACRLDHLKAGLKGGGTVTTAMTAAGYGSSSRLYEKAGGQLGMTPGEYRRGGEKQRIRFTTAACDFGRVLLAGTDRGVCWLNFADTDAEAEAALGVEFPLATIGRDNIACGKLTVSSPSTPPSRLNAAKPTAFIDSRRRTGVRPGSWGARRERPAR